MIEAEIDFLVQFVEIGLKEKLQIVLDKDSVRITNKEAIGILRKADKKYENELLHGEDLSKEYEKYLTEEYLELLFL